MMTYKARKEEAPKQLRMDADTMFVTKENAKKHSFEQMGSTNVPLHGDSGYHTDDYFWMTTGDLRCEQRNYFSSDAGDGRALSDCIHLPHKWESSASSPARRKGCAKPTVGFTSQLDHLRNPNWRISCPSSNSEQLSYRSLSSSPVMTIGLLSLSPF